jgi:heparan-alpha-glucosaminide N-acetyltransferase
MGQEPAFAATSKPSVQTGRLLSLDAYRGLTMLAMISAGLRMERLREDATWGKLADQLDHRLWEGCTAWDLIQPSFLFMVGVAMPFSFARRMEQGQSWGRQFLHVLQRCLLLAVIGNLLDCYAQQKVGIQFIRVLQQIALAYPIAFLVLHRGPATQVLTAIVILILHPLAFVLFHHFAPFPAYEPWGSDAFGMSALAIAHQGGSRAVNAWSPEYNFGLCLDSILHLPISRGCYVTFNAFSSAATIIFGILCGEMFRNRWPSWAKLYVLVAAGALGLWLGWELTAWVPMVKRLWTTSFAVFAGGWTCLLMATLYLIIDILQLRRWAFPLVVVGMNSIAIYVFAGLFDENLRRGLSPFVELVMARKAPWFPVILAVLAVGVNWLLCYWLYRHRIFFKL